MEVQVKCKFCASRASGLWSVCKDDVTRILPLCAFHGLSDLPSRRGVQVKIIASLTTDFVQRQPKQQTKPSLVRVETHVGDKIVVSYKLHKPRGQNV